MEDGGPHLSPCRCAAPVVDLYLQMSEKPDKSFHPDTVMDATLPTLGDGVADPTATMWPVGSLRAELRRRDSMGDGVPMTRVTLTDSDQPILAASSDETFQLALKLIPKPVAKSDTGFELGMMLGRGGMGEVYEAMQGSLQRAVALKTIRADNWEGTANDPAGRDVLRTEFIRESLITARLEHPNIAPVHDLVFTGESRQPQLAMKLVHGQSWNVMLHHDFEELSEVDFIARHLPILEDMAQAVAFAHSRGIMHRDLKPGQVMVGGFGETLLMDWGLALQFAEVPDQQIRGDLPADIPTLQTATNPAGTPSLMAPEQTEATPHRLGAHTDVYLLGGTLYMILTGQYPHEGATPRAAMLKAAEGIVMHPKLRAPERWIPDDLAELAMKAMQPEPKDRVPSAEAFIKGLRDYLSGAGRRRESEALVAEAKTFMVGISENLEPRAAYIRHGAVAERMTRALELWPENRAAQVLKAANLEARLATETSGGDLLLAETHLAELRSLAEAEPELSIQLPPLEAALRRAHELRDRQHRQRKILTWVATLLLLGHALGMTFSFFRSQRFANQLFEQKTELSRRSDQDIRELSTRMGHLLMEANRPAEAMQYFAKSLALSAVLDAPGSPAAEEAARNLATASEAARAASEARP